VRPHTGKSRPWPRLGRGQLGAHQLCGVRRRRRRRSSSASAQQTHGARGPLSFNFGNRLTTADLAITKTDGKDEVVPGTPTTYTLVVSNAGPSAVSGASVSDPPPAGATGGNLAFAGATGGGSVTGPASGSGPLVTTVDLRVGASVTFTFTVAIDPAATGALVNTATVTPPAGVTDPNPADKRDSDRDTLSNWGCAGCAM
jgi:uncharacterized repeat protein (TIGR01451 family)